MMKHKKVFTLAALVSISFCLFMTACTLPSDEENNCTVSFVTNCEELIPSETVAENGFLSSVAAISSEGKTFVGWYTTADFSGEKIEFPFLVTMDITLYAKWETPAPITCTVSFVTNCTGSIPSETIAENGFLSSVANITADGKTFVGWYTTAEFSGEKIELPFSVTSDITLYGRWETSVAESLLKFTRNDNEASYTVAKAASAESAFPSTLVLPDSYGGLPVTMIASEGFAGITTIDTVIVGQFTTSIDSNAFINCTALATILLPDSVVDTTNSCFSNTAWQNAQPDGLLYIGKMAYFYKGEIPKDSEIVVREGTKGLASYVLGWESNIKSISLPKSLEVIGWDAISYNSSMVSITVDPENKIYQSIDGNVYSKDGKMMLHYAIGKPDTSFRVPDGVMKLADQVFFYSLNLKEVILPDSVIELADGVFNECQNLTSVKLGKNLAKIGSGVFFDCKNLTSIVIPISLTEMGVQVFGSCSKLTIFAEAAVQPEGWGNGWNSSNRPVRYDGTWEYVDGVPTPII